MNSNNSFGRGDHGARNQTDNEINKHSERYPSVELLESKHRNLSEGNRDTPGANRLRERNNQSTHPYRNGMSPAIDRPKVNNHRTCLRNMAAYVSHPSFQNTEVVFQPRSFVPGDSYPPPSGYQFATTIPPPPRLSAATNRHFTIVRPEPVRGTSAAYPYAFTRWEPSIRNTRPISDELPNEMRKYHDDTYATPLERPAVDLTSYPSEQQTFNGFADQSAN